MAMGSHWNFENPAYLQEVGHAVEPVTVLLLEDIILSLFDARLEIHLTRPLVVSHVHVLREQA